MLPFLPAPGRPSRRPPLLSVLVPTLLAVVLLLPALAPPLLAAPSTGAWAGWAEGPVGYLLTDDERERWETVRTDAEAERFVDLFWSRRDPDLKTPPNELKLEIERRIAIADARFGGEERRGSLTDRGKVLVLLGEPRASQRRIGEDQVRQPGERLTREGGEDRVIWEYEVSDLPVALPAARLLVGFYELRRGLGEFVLDRSAPGASLVLRALRRAPEAYVVHPRLERPVHPASATPPLDLSALDPLQDRAGQDRAGGRAALPDADAAVADGRPRAPRRDRAPGSSAVPPSASPTQAVPDPELAGWFLVDPAPWPDGARLLALPGAGAVADDSLPAWLQLELPADSPPVERLAVQWWPSGGAPLPTLEELPFERRSLNGGTAYQAALSLPPGEYVVTVAAGAGPRPTAVARATVRLTPVPDRGTWLSEVYAAPHVEQRPEGAPGSPFWVAGWQLVPDPRVLPGQQLSYFGYVSTPVGEEAPRLTASITLSNDGKSLASPFRESLEPSPVRDGLWMYGSSLALDGLPPGDGYVLTFRVEEQASGAEGTGRVRFGVGPG